MVGRSLVDEQGKYTRRGITPSTTHRLATRYAPPLVPLLWLASFQGSITSTVLRTESVREAGGFGDTNMGEDWQLAARLSRRGKLVCTDQPVRIYHRHPNTLRNRADRRTWAATTRQIICDDCRTDPHATPVQKLTAIVWRGRSRTAHNS